MSDDLPDRLLFFAAYVENDLRYGYYAHDIRAAAARIDHLEDENARLLTLLAYATDTFEDGTA